MTNNNDKEYTVIQEKPVTTCDTDLLGDIKIPVNYTNIYDVPTVSNTEIPEEGTMVLENDTLTTKSTEESKLETVATDNEDGTMETEKTYITKNKSVEYTVNETFTFPKPSVSSEHCPLVAHTNRREIIKTDTKEYLLPANPTIYPNFIFNYDDKKYFALEKISPEKFEAGLWDYITKPLNPNRTYKSQYPHTTGASNKPFDVQKLDEPTDSLPLGIDCDNLESLTTVFHRIPEENQRGNMDSYICNSCNCSSNGLPGNQCNDCLNYYHWNCVAHTEAPNYGIAWFCVECLRKKSQSDQETPYLALFNDALHYGDDDEECNDDI